MIVKKDINWYLNDPIRLLQKIPFTRGCGVARIKNISGETVDINETVIATIPTNTGKTIGQDVYLMEYDPSMHDILYNQSIPTIAVKVGNRVEPLERIVKTASLQKNIHSLHVLHLTGNPMQFTLSKSATPVMSKIFDEYKCEYMDRNMDIYRNAAVSKQKKVGDVGVLHYFKNGEYKVNILSYDNGYAIIENTDEDNDVISRSAYYRSGNVEIIDTYDNTYRYRHARSLETTDLNNNGWVGVDMIEHRFPFIPLQYKRGYVAWEFGQSNIDMYELIDNIIAVVQKRFGQFAIWIKGDVNEDTFQSDGTVMIINDPDADSNGEMKTVEFPNPQGLLDYKNDILKDIQRACSVTFIDPDMIKLGGDPSGTAILLTMKNDIALATQSISDWASFNDEFTYLSQYGFDMERAHKKNGSLGYFTQIRIKARMTVWTPEAVGTLIANLVAEKSLGLSDQTILEMLPHAAADEITRKQHQMDAEIEYLELQSNTSNKLTADVVVQENKIKE